jgi:membrane protein YqaA with SNARE-associated domain
MTDKGEIKEIVREADKLEREVLPPEPAVPATPRIANKPVTVFLVCFYAALFLIRFAWLEGPSFFSILKQIVKPNFIVPASGSILWGYFLYMCIACQFFPIPTLPPIAFSAKVFSPVLIALVGALGTCIANLNDYAIVGWLFEHHRVKKIRNVNTYQRLLTFFDRYAFLTLSAAAFLPIPVDVIRLLAISRAYPLWKYLGAAFVGRFPRYLLIAYLGKELPAKYILILFLVSALPAAYKLVSDMIKKRRKKA